MCGFRSIRIEPQGGDVRRLHIRRLIHGPLSRS